VTSAKQLNGKNGMSLFVKIPNTNNVKARNKERKNNT